MLIVSNIMIIKLRKLAHAIYREFFSAVKIEIFYGKKFDIFNIFAQTLIVGTRR